MSETISIGCSAASTRTLPVPWLDCNAILLAAYSWNNQAATPKKFPTNVAFIRIHIANHDQDHGTENPFQFTIPSFEDSAIHGNLHRQLHAVQGTRLTQTLTTIIPKTTKAGREMMMHECVEIVFKGIGAIRFMA